MGGGCGTRYFMCGMAAGRGRGNHVPMQGRGQRIGTADAHQRAPHEWPQTSILAACAKLTIVMMQYRYMIQYWCCCGHSLRLLRSISHTVRQRCSSLTESLPLNEMRMCILPVIRLAPHVRPLFPGLLVVQLPPLPAAPAPPAWPLRPAPAANKANSNSRSDGGHADEKWVRAGHGA